VKLAARIRRNLFPVGHECGIVFLVGRGPEPLNDRLKTQQRGALMKAEKANRHTMVTLRIAGAHDADAEIYRDRVRVYIPGAVITIGDMDAAHSVNRVWRDAALTAPKIFSPEGRADGYRPPGSTIWVAVNLTGKIVGRDIQGKIPSHSPSKCGELKVRIGSLVIVMDDLAAAESQIKVWREANTQAWKVFRNLE
jgi:hypothetical protein